MEQNLGFRNPTIMVNTHRAEEGKSVVCRSCVMNTFHQMGPVITKIKKRNQGNIYQEKWQLARYNQTKQFMIMLGWLTHDDLKKEYLNAPIPHEYDPLHLPSITCEQIVWYDEMHIEQEGGANGNGGYQVRFHRDEEGKYSPSSPRLAPENRKTTFKYPEQARFCLGVCKVKLLNGSFEGRKCRVFDYTCKKIISIQDYEMKTRQEILRVKSLKSDKATSPWIKRTRPDGCDH